MNFARMKGTLLVSTSREACVISCFALALEIVQNSPVIFDQICVDSFRTYTDHFWLYPDGSSRNASIKSTSNPIQNSRTLYFAWFFTFNLNFDAFAGYPKSLPL